MLSTFRSNNVTHLRYILLKKDIITQRTLHLLKRTYFCCGHNNIPTTNKQKQFINENNRRINSCVTINRVNIKSHSLNSNKINYCTLNSLQIKKDSDNSHRINAFNRQKRDLYISTHISSSGINSQPIKYNSNRINTFTNQKRVYSTRNTVITSNCNSLQINSNSQRINSILCHKRVHSTRSDQHRQKVVIETASTPVEKLEFEKVMPIEKDEKSLWDRIEPYTKLARWDKPIGVYLLYWPCTWSIALATIHTGVDLETSFRMAGLFLIGAGLMRGAGCTINDMWDKDIDRQVERTSDRPLASGAVTTRQATTFLAIQLSAALSVLLQLNCFSVALGASSMLLVISYPLAKRFWNYPQLFLGATFNWGALLGFSAISGALGLQTLPLYAGALAWTVVYDTIYAHQDKLDDARIGIKSTALTFGANTKPLLSGILLASAAGLVTAGHMAELSPVYDAAIAAYVVHVGRQIYTLDVDNPTDCAKKFKSNSLVGLIILLGIIGGGYEKYLENRKKNEGKNLKEHANSCLFS